MTHLRLVSSTPDNDEEVLRGILAACFMPETPENMRVARMAFREGRREWETEFRGGPK